MRNDVAYRAAVSTSEELHDQLRIIGVDDALTRAAGDLAAEHELRGYDAVQLASALAIKLPTSFSLPETAHRTGHVVLDEH